jgi:hypothetical protein
MTEAELWDKAIEYQYLHRGGFCGYCGEACKPFYKNLPQELIDTACEYNGEHPDCGNHEWTFIEKTPETFGAYEIWECNKCKFREAI